MIDHPDHITVVDGDGIPDFAVDMSELERASLHLAAGLAKHCDTPEKVSNLLGNTAVGNVGSPVYMSGLFLQALKYLTEDILAPLLAVAEMSHPEHDFRGKLAKLHKESQG